MEFSLLLLVSATFAALTIYIIRPWSSQNPRNRPPGPRPKPLFGNLLDFPTHDSAAAYVEWGSKYNSDILYASALGSHVLVLNKVADAVELLEGRSEVYSDRPALPVIDLMGWDINISLMPYGSVWRRHKKVLQQHLRLEAGAQYVAVQRAKMRQFLRNLVRDPEGLELHSKLFSVGIPLSTMYAYDVAALPDPCVDAADESALRAATLLLPGGSLVNFFPFLRHVPAWVPGAVSKRTAVRVKKLTRETVRVPMEDLKRRMAQGSVPPSLVSSFLERKGASAGEDEDERVIENVAYTVYGAASDTTIAATGTFFYLMATHPAVQKEAQAELDRVVGTARLPSFDDRPALPYIEAVYREVLRWKAPLPLGMPHVLSEDDWYKGYFIPKGTTVFANIWAMTHDADVYDEAAKFSPERFLDENGRLNDDDRILAYGFGRRICVGRDLASSSMWLMIASVLAAFTIGKAQDEHGEDIPIGDGYKDGGLIQHKVPFRCAIKPRSERARALVTEEGDAE